MGQYTKIKNTLAHHHGKCRKKYIRKKLRNILFDYYFDGVFMQ